MRVIRVVPYAGPYADLRPGQELELVVTVQTQEPALLLLAVTVR